MTANAEQYINIVLEYAQSTTTNLKKIIFKSKKQTERRENSTMTKLTSSYSKSFIKNQWSLQYQYISNTHDLICTNNNSRNKTKLILTKPLKIANTNYIANKQDIIPSYFMQVTNVDEDSFHIEVIANKVHNKSRKLFIKEVNDSNVSLSRTVIKIKKNKISAQKEIDIDEKHSESYHLALYGGKT
eukprot:210561_1